MALDQNIGMVTAYAYAVSKGYTGTEEQFAQELASAGADLSQIQTQIDNFINTIVPAKTAEVTAEGTRQIGLVAAEGTAQKNAVTAEGTTQKNAVNSAGSTQVNAVNSAGSTQVGNVNTAGSTQVGAVQAKGQEVINSIPSDYTALSDDVDDLKSAVSPLIGETVIDLSSGEHRGAFIGSAGNISQTSGSFAYSAPIKVINNKRYTFTASGTPIIAALSTCDEYGNNRNVIHVYSATDTEQTFTYEPSADGYIVLSYNYSFTYTLESCDINLKSVRYSADKIDYYADEVDAVTEKAETLLDFSNVIIGQDWTGGTNVARAVLYITAQPDTEYYYDFRDMGNFLTASAVEKATQTGGALASTALENKTGSFATKSNTKFICIQVGKGSAAITESDFDGWNPYFGTHPKDYITAKDSVARAYAKPWSGKKLVWLGTSIPAGGKYDISNPNSYPIMVGKMLEATVYNEAVGSSALHCKDPNRISASNPYGFLANFEAVSRCITNSLTEMNWIIDHYNDSAVFTQNVPSSLSDADKEFIRSCSWEIKLQKYFTADDFPDAWIIDHGHNDIPSATSEATYTDKTDMSGTQHDGYYTGGNFVSSVASSYLEFDVTDELYVWISGSFGSWYDIYDIFDAEGNRIDYRQNASAADVTDVKVNVANAKTLRVSNPNNLISTISVKRLTYPTYNSLYSYNGAFDFIVNKILAYNPKARIIMIGEYENQKYPTISENQLIASHRWEFPIYKQWENLGWSQQYILVNGEYKTMLNIIIPDNLHPHTDTTGYALRQMAKNIAAWLNTVR